MPLLKLEPNVFIIESLQYEDEMQNKFEGKIIQDMLSLSFKKTRYIYIRTLAEFKFALDEFKKSKFRYLHISCHGTKKGIATTLEDINFTSFGDLVSPYLSGVRMFFSSCSVANYYLAHGNFSHLRKTNCISVVGPSNDIEFNDAAVAWVSFYHLMFKKDKMRMKNDDIKDYIELLNLLFGVSLKFIDKFEFKDQTKKILNMIKRNNLVEKQ